MHYSLIENVDITYATHTSNISSPVVERCY